MESKATEGPYRAVATPNGWTIYAKDGSEVVADFDTEEANARLLAASWEMRAFIAAVLDAGYLPADVPFAGMTIREMGDLLVKIDGTPTTVSP